jgi:hypothetical protein
MLSRLSDSLYRTEANLLNLLFRQTGTLILLVMVGTAMTLAGIFFFATVAQNLLYAIIVTSLPVGILTFFLLHHLESRHAAAIRAEQDQAGWHWLL